MSYAESIDAIRAHFETEMDHGRMRETPGAVIAETDRLTGDILHKITRRGARKKEKQAGLAGIFAASVVEDQLVRELKDQDKG